MPDNVKETMAKLAERLTSQAGHAAEEAAKREFERLAGQINRGEYTATVATSFHVLKSDARSTQATFAAQLALEEIISTGVHVGTIDSFLERVITRASNRPRFVSTISEKALFAEFLEKGFYQYGFDGRRTCFNDPNQMLLDTECDYSIDGLHDELATVDNPAEALEEAIDRLDQAAANLRFLQDHFALMKDERLASADDDGPDGDIASLAR
ncbi:hypothetical protein [Nitratireductor sp. StC3]|uniref:hypothetical protein n=1 Tax=Nitratireductor sp. StC3 TaxID=2126741 RepID=UPI000D0CD7AF|nr:hypothetical protein [Nitratireductor sp. StC3]PSM18508.1 hypothetical protein C7T96_11745 [Nitratireductor sp. StC3]